jgi:hypothetical protein
MHNYIKHCDHVVSDGETFGGMPYVQGTDVSIEHILHALLVSTITNECINVNKIIEEFPQLRKDDINSIVYFLIETVRRNFALPQHTKPDIVKQCEQHIFVLDALVDSAESEVKYYGVDSKHLVGIVSGIESEARTMKEMLQKQSINTGENK